MSESRNFARALPISDVAMGLGRALGVDGSQARLTNSSPLAPLDQGVGLIDRLRDTNTMLRRMLLLLEGGSRPSDPPDQPITVAELCLRFAKEDDTGRVHDAATAVLDAIGAAAPEDVPAIALAGAAGDLFESALKRDLQVKDSGRLLGAHGGVLDRVDALLFASVAAFYVVAAFGYG